MEKDNIRFQKLFGFGERFRNRYLHTLSAYKLFDEFNKLSTENIVGRKKANENIKIFNKYSYFILTSKESLRCFFLIELAKFFDEGSRKQNLSVKYALNYANLKIDSFSIEQFYRYHKDRKIIPELFERYKPLSKKDLEKINKRIDYNKATIKRLKDYRDQYLAHDDIKKKDVPINKKDVNTLMNIVKDTIELIYHKLEFASNSYKNYEEEPVQDINRLINDLRVYEKLRLAKLEKEYRVKVKMFLFCQNCCSVRYVSVYKIFHNFKIYFPHYTIPSLQSQEDVVMLGKI